MKGDDKMSDDNQAIEDAVLEAMAMSVKYPQPSDKDYVAAFPGIWRRLQEALKKLNQEPYQGQLAQLSAELECPVELKLHLSPIELSKYVLTETRKYRSASGSSFIECRSALLEKLQQIESEKQAAETQEQANPESAAIQ